MRSNFNEGRERACCYEGGENQEQAGTQAGTYSSFSLLPCLQTHAHGVVIFAARMCPKTEPHHHRTALNSLRSRSGLGPGSPVSSPLQLMACHGSVVSFFWEANLLQPGRARIREHAGCSKAETGNGLCSMTPIVGYPGLSTSLHTVGEVPQTRTAVHIPVVIRLDRASVSCAVCNCCG